MAGRDEAPESVRRRALRATLSHVVAVSRQMRRRREARIRRHSLLQRSLLQRLFPAHPEIRNRGTAATAPEAVGPDPVRIAVLAIDSVGRASMRACFTGSEVDVAAPDEATASVLRRALAVTGQTRATDRLVRIVVD